MKISILALFAGLLAAGAGVGAKELGKRSTGEPLPVGAAKRRTAEVLRCGAAAVGEIDPAVDLPYRDLFPGAPDDGTFVDLFLVDLAAGAAVTIDYRSDALDPFLIVYGPDGAELGFNDDVRPGFDTDARFTIGAATMGRHMIAANSFEPAAGAYEVTVSCSTGGGGDGPETPVGPLNEWTYLYAWDGIYWQPGSDAEDAVVGQGLALDIQRGTLFGALYTYDGAGDDAFLTLQSEEATVDGRAYTGTVFRTRGAGSETQAVGTFALELTGVRGQRGVLFTISSPYLELTASRWVRFGFLDEGPLDPWRGARALVEVLVEAAAARDLLTAVGSRLDFAGVPVEVMGEGGVEQVLELAAAPGFSGTLRYDAAAERYRLTIASDADPGDAVALEVIAGHNDWVGVATVSVDGTVIARGNAVGLNFAATRALAKGIRPLGPPIDRGKGSATPVGDPEDWSFLHAWDGIYWQPGNGVDPAVAGQGLALDIQRGVLFGALYSYDGAGDEAFLTLQTDAPSVDGRRFAGTVFRTRGSGSEAPEAVGTFTIDLIGEAGQRSVRFTLTSPYLVQSASRWVRFGFLDRDPFTPWADDLTVFTALVDTPAAQALVAAIGPVFVVDGERLDDGSPFLAVLPEQPGFSGRLRYDAALGRYVLRIERDEDPDDALVVTAIAGDDDWVGEAEVFLDGERVGTGTALGLNAATLKFPPTAAKAGAGTPTVPASDRGPRGADRGPPGGWGDLHPDRR